MALSRNLFLSIVAVGSLGAIALAASTSCSPGFTNPYPGWDGAYPTYDGELPNADLFPYIACKTDILPTYDDALLDASPAALDQGALDVPLSAPVTYPGGEKPVSCLRLRVTRDGGGAITERRLVWVSVNENVTKLEEHVLYRMTKTQAGYRNENDPNGDGSPEEISEVALDGAGAWTGTVTTTYDGPSKKPIRRFTSAPKDALVSSLRQEHWNGSAWDLDADFDIGRDQQKCVSPADLPAAPPETGSKAPGCKKIACSKAQREQILDGMKQAIKKSENCLPSAITNKPATELASGLIEPQCMTGAGCGYGETTSEGTPTKDHPRPVLINVDHLNDGQFMPTVGHELVHIGLGERGAHPKTKQQLASLLGKGLLVDRTYACEAMCFPSPNFKPTQCDCAACLDEVIQPDGSTKRATRCSQQCAGFAPCTAAGNSPDTGAYCERQKIFCDTVDECRTECVTGADACGKKDPKTGHYNREGGNLSRACDPSCD